MLYAKLSPRDESLPSFNLATLMYAQRHYRPFWHKSPERNSGQACGVMQLAHTDKERQLQQKLRDKFSAQHPDNDLIEFVDAAKASEIAGANIDHSGIHFKHAGWLSPQAVCRDLSRHPNITVISNSEINRLASETSEWQAYTEDGTLVAHADIAIIAAASDAMALAQTAHLPLKPIRGQISYLPATKASRALKTVVCAEGYLSPAIADTDDAAFFNGLGASFNLRDNNTELTEIDHQNNLDKLSNHTPALSELFDTLNAKDLGGRVAFRCTTPDYLPLVGPVPIKDDFLETFALLRKNAKSSIPSRGPHYPNLYTSVGYGSRGLAYTPLTAQYLAAQICGEPSPMPNEYLQALHPGRFMIRNLIKNKM
jgi:tRNA 5-methylaminomethyl-2-thiouridine biosynthesis bifunctional protein